MISQLLGIGFAHGGMHPLGFFPFGLLSWVGGLLFIAGLLLAAVWLFRALDGTRLAFYGQPASNRQTPLDILQRRFAAGEISAEQYASARDTLTGAEPPKP